MDTSFTEHVIVKTEMQSNGEILLFYVDENGGNEEGVITTVQNIESDAIELQQIADPSTNALAENVNEDGWTDDLTNRLLIFYIDNKTPFLSGATKRDHLWTVACKTMLIGKNPVACEAKLTSLREKYLEGCWFQKNGINNVIVPFQELCHQAFHDDNFEMKIIEPDVRDINNAETVQVSVQNKITSDIPVNIAVSNKTLADEKVNLLLNLYQKYMKILQKDYTTRKDLWDIIAKEIGEDDGVYWQKRFYNYKQHYLRMVEKRKSGGVIKWPYMEIFDKLFEDKTESPKKITSLQSLPTIESVKKNPNYWNDTEITVLAKYCFDCFDEFIDETVPKNFLWTEIGRLLDRPSDLCKLKYGQLKNQHYDKYIEGGYEIRERKPFQIILDYIICKEVEVELKSDKAVPNDVWKRDNVDEIVKFMYQNIEMFKDQVCHFVCWSAISKKLKKNLRGCKKQWDDLVQQYKNILEDKKEDPSMQIEWRYIELFDRIFDYGMDTKLLNGYENMNKQFNVKKVTVNMAKETLQGSDEDSEIYDEDDTKNKHAGDSKAFKILEYYQKNKDKFTSSHRNKHSLWEVLAKQIGISATQCAHRLRNLKQVYTAYVQREINKPEMPIFWPYYVLCKKVFGYRAIKAKLRNSKQDTDVIEWSAKEIKMLLNYLAEHFNKIDSNIEDLNNWSSLANDIAKSEQSCKEKFLELRRSYRKLKTKMASNPSLKISWKYYGIMDRIYGESATGMHNGNVDAQENMEVEQLEEWMDDKSQQDDDDYQCIIVMPEDQDVSSMDTSQTQVTETDIPTNISPKPPIKWTKQLKKRLLVSYIKYIRANKGKKINAKEMWKEISTQLDKKPITCKKLFVKLKANHIKNKDVKTTPYFKLLERLLKLKPKFEKVEKNSGDQEKKVYKDVEMSPEIVIKALQYYLQHVDEFASPKFDKKCLWQELADFVTEPVSKVYKKINFLKQAYSAENTCGVGEFDDLIKDIRAKDEVKTVNDSVPEIFDETPWSDEEVKRLLEWYLSNLEKFKNPKFVRKYLWMEVSRLLNKSPLSCSKKMTEIRMQYKTMVKEKPGDLECWHFSDLCQKIYGTGKKAV